MADAKTPSLKEYWKLLNWHDWNYDYSDDPHVWREGRESAYQIQSISRSSPDHKELYLAFCAHVFSGPEYKKPEVPKPPQPE